MPGSRSTTRCTTTSCAKRTTPRCTTWRLETPTLWSSTRSGCFAASSSPRALLLQLRLYPLMMRACLSPHVSAVLRVTAVLIVVKAVQQPCLPSVTRAACTRSKIMIAGHCCCYAATSGLQGEWLHESSRQLQHLNLHLLGLMGCSAVRQLPALSYARRELESCVVLPRLGLHSS